MKSVGRVTLLGLTLLVASAACLDAPTGEQTHVAGPGQQQDAQTQADAGAGGCAPGYRALPDGGCEDIDECRLRLLCGPYGKCTNTPGGHRCECPAKGFTEWRNFCICAEGYTRSLDGRCLAFDGRACSDDAECLNHHCVSGICCAQACDQPGECRSAERASCSDGKNCVYALAPDDSPCDDALACTVDSKCREGVCMPGRPAHCDDGNPCTDDVCEEPLGCKVKNNTNSCDDRNACTQEDRCDGGYCTGKAKDCRAFDSVCHAGTCNPATGQCESLQQADGTACDDHDSCTSGDYCAAGSCNVLGNACGPNALACSPVAGSATEYECACRVGFIQNQRGRCAPVNDECLLLNVCSPDANCDDPSNLLGDRVCTCKPGFTGDGMTCTRVDPCKDNPCGEGRGTCQPTATGSFTCTCNAGYIALNNTCACDLSGTFAARSRMDLAWDRLSGAIESGSDTVYSYAIERHTYNGDGQLTLEMTMCGSSTLDFCGVGVAPMVAAEAYSQYLPVEIWELPSSPKLITQVRLTTGQPGSLFETPIISMLRGISLTDPAGPWPAKASDVAGGPNFDGTATNGASWLDQDDDGFLGVTSYVVPPGGVPADGVPPDPPRTYGAISPVCPRNGGAHTSYAYWPAPAESVSGVPIRVKRFYTASRIISAYRGTITSCDQIAGDIVGVNSGPVQLEARIGGCIRDLSGGETACSNTAIDFIDTAAQSEKVLAASFLIKRWPSNLPVTCSAARSFNYD